MLWSFNKFYIIEHSKCRPSNIYQAGQLNISFLIPDFVSFYIFENIIIPSIPLYNVLDQTNVVSSLISFVSGKMEPFTC